MGGSSDGGALCINKHACAVRLKLHGLRSI